MIGVFLALLLVLGAGLEVSAAAVSFPSPLPEVAGVEPARAELGRALFFDRRLSGDGTLSCAVCHVPELGYADGRVISEAYPTNRHWRHTPSLINLVYQRVFLWDGRAASAQQQALGPLQAPFEMNLDPDYLVARLRAVPFYRRSFAEAWGGEVTVEKILDSLAAFQATLIVRDAPFDRFLAGEAQALDAQARQGAEIFFGPRGDCVRCHQGALLSDEKFHNLGLVEPSELVNDPLVQVTRNYFLAKRGLPASHRDPGRFVVTRKMEDLGAFRTPALRQVAETAPYMHNGSLSTLEAVVDFFNQGGGEGPGRSDQLRPLGLEPAEKAALVAFLKSLSGTVPLARPVAIPED